MFKSCIWLAISTCSVFLLLSGCATVIQPKLERGDTITPSISYDRAFEHVIKAGDDIGFEPARYPKPDRERGIVTLMAKAETGERVVKALFFSPLWTHFVLEIRINRDGNMATGVHLKVTQAGGATVKKEEMEALVKTYLDALRKRWR